MQNALSRFLNWLQEELLPHSKDLSSFNLPHPEVQRPLSNSEAMVDRERAAYNPQEEMEKVKIRLPLLNNNQRAFFDSVMAALNDDKSGRIFCLDAPGGTGKTFVLNCLLNALRADGHICIATAMSAVASQLLEGGSTLHSKLKVVMVNYLSANQIMYQVPIDVNWDTFCNFTDACGTGSVVKQTILLLIDEVTMGHRHIFEAIERSTLLLLEQSHT